MTENRPEQQPVQPDLYCRDMVREDDPARYQTALFAPASKQPALWALYAFNQEVAKTRENVSEPALGEIRLQWWRDAIGELRLGTGREHPVVKAAAQHICNEEVLSLLDALIEARQLDLYADGPANKSALEDYAVQVGGGLSEAALMLSDPHCSQQALDAVRASGAAWAMLGLVRAIPFHWADNRNFLPGNEGKAASAQTNADKMFEAAKPVIADMLDYVKSQLGASNASAEQFSSKTLHTMLLNVQSGLYVEALQNAGNNPFKLVEPSELRKLWRQLKAKWTGKF